MCVCTRVISAGMCCKQSQSVCMSRGARACADELSDDIAFPFIKKSD